MRPLRVNADYEVELFHNRPAPPVINQTIEFFLFFLSSRPLFSSKKYSEEYLEHVQKITGRSPQIISQGPYENFWGLLSDLDLERWWNSKITSTQLIIDKGWCRSTHIVKNDDDLSFVDWNKTYLLKDPNGMSGQKFLLLRPQDLFEEKMAAIKRALTHGPQVIEPWFDRRFDFSQYVFPDGRVIAYQNLVDQKFQYKGTLFPDLASNALEDLPFHSHLSSEAWDQFKHQTQEIIQYYSQQENVAGYSIDSFIYQENDSLKIRVMSEVNYRRTMGRVAYELSETYRLKNNWSALLLVKNHKSSQPLWERLESLKDVKVLSPGNSRFDIIFLTAQDQAAGLRLISQVNALLANGELTIKI